MKIFIKNKVFFFCGFWIIYIVAIYFISNFFYPLRIGFLGPLRLANMDGVHYLSISENGYYQFEHAFFPLYPLLIKILSNIFNINSISAGLVISLLSFLGICIFFPKVDANINKRQSLSPLIYYLVFPMSFFFVTVYTESFYVLLSLACLFASRKQKWLIAGICGFLASLTRLFGIFLIIPVFFDFIKTKKRNIQGFTGILLIFLGLIIYMMYLWLTVGDAFAFFHAQPAFGAGRSGDSLILLPQVLVRYIRIFLTVPFWSLSYGVAFLEMITFIFSIILIIYGFKNKIIPKGYLWYCLCVIILPTLTGTLSSIPRYVLSAFPLFFILGKVHNTSIKIIYVLASIIIQFVCASLFFQGYFIS